MNAQGQLQGSLIEVGWERQGTNCFRPVNYKGLGGTQTVPHEGDIHLFKWPITTSNSGMDFPQMI